jgi:hypothetical protein
LNLVEFAYFPAAGFIFQPSITPVCVASNGLWQPGQFTSLYPLTIGSVYRVTMTYDTTMARLTTQMTRDGAPFPDPPATIQTVSLAGSFADFRLDAFVISSYSDAVQAAPPMQHGSLLAHGWVDNVRLTFPTPARPFLDGHWAQEKWQVSFASLSDWTYCLERSEDCLTWAQVTGAAPGTGGTLVLTDLVPPASRALYRVAADRP